MSEIPSGQARKILPACLFSTFIIAGIALVARGYPATDGGKWLQAVPSALHPYHAPFLLAAAIALLAGAGASLLTTRGGSRGTALVAGISVVAAAAALAWIGHPADRLSPWFDAPDWIRVTLFLVAGAAWGLGWGLASATIRIRPPLWGFLLPFALSAAIVAILSHSLGPALILLWLLLVAPALGVLGWSSLSPSCWFAPEVPSRSIRERFAASGAPHPGSSGRPREWPPHLIQFCLGLTFLGCLGWILGMIHLAYRGTLLAALILLTLLLFGRVLRSAKAAIRQARAPVFLSPVASALLGLIASILLCQFIAALGPEAGGDSTGGRVALPVIWMRHGAISAQPEIILSYLTLGGESLFLLLLPLAGYSVAKLVAFACLLAALGAIVGPGFRRDKTWPIAAAAVFAGSTVVWWQFLWGFCDLLQAVLILGAAESLRRWLLRADRRALIAAGLLAGAATAVKLNGAFAIIAVVGIAFAATVWRRRAALPAIRASLCAGIPAALVLGPALLRTTVLAGNPLLPFANRVFKSPLVPLDPYGAHYGLAPGSGLWRMVENILLNPGVFAEWGAYHPMLLPLLAGGVVAIFLGSRAVRFWSAAFLVSGAFWIMTDQNLRYSLFVALFGLLVLARATTVLRLCRFPFRFSTASILIAAAVFAGASLELARPAFGLMQGNNLVAFPLRWALGRETTDRFLRTNQLTYSIAQAANAEAGTKGRIWQMPWTRDHLYFQGTVVAMPHGDLRMLAPLYALLPGSGPDLAPSRMAAVLHSSGITHLVMAVDNPWEEHLPESEWTSIYSPAFTQTWLDPMAANQVLRLYRLRDLPRAGPAAAAIIGREPLVPSIKNYPVRGNQLYQIELLPVPRAKAGDFVEFAWYDHAEKLIELQMHALPPGSAKGWHGWWQSAPPNAGRLELGVGASHPECMLEIRAPMGLTGRTP